MQFLSPEFLYIYPLLLLATWIWLRSVIFRPLRLAITTLLFVALAQPQFSLVSEGLDLWVLCDRSDSAQELLSSKEDEWFQLLEKSKGSRDNLHFVDYATEAFHKDPQAKAEKINTANSKLGKALRYTASLANPKRANRFLVLSDGYSSDSLAGLEERLSEQKVALDYRLLGLDKGIDYTVKDFKLPKRIQPGEAFLIEGEISGDRDGSIDCTIKRNNKVVHRGALEIKDGKGQLRLFDRIQSGGSHLYQIEIDAPNDNIKANNHAESWVHISGGQKVLVLSSYSNDPIIEILQNNGFDAELITKAKNLRPEKLATAKLVILNNIPAWEVNNDFLKALEFYVHYQGGGLIMVGGKHSFGAGAYAQSTVEELMPVSMELKIEHRKLQVAMSIVMDRSGSMGATVDSGQTKMDLANDGAARTVELLGIQDFVAVSAVDSTSHNFVPLQSVGDNRQAIIRKTRSIKSQGGGIYVYEGLKEAWKELQKSPAGQKHIILFSDAADSEQPGKYKNLIADMRSADATISVIALGEESDSDADFLKDIAKRGEGRIFFSTDANDIPSFFAQEAVAVARSSFAEEPTPTTSLPDWNTIAQTAINWPKAIDGYNINYAKKEGANALICQDEYSSPLVSWWHRGSGKAAAIAFPLAGDKSQRIRQWQDYGNFIQSLARWTAAPKAPNGISLQHSFDGDTLFLQLYFSAEWAEKFSLQEPKIYTVSSASKDIRHSKWQRQNPQLYQTRFELKSGESISGVVQIGQQSLNFGPFTPLKNSEWDLDHKKINDLKKLAQISGGRERINLADAWQRPKAKFMQSLSPYFILLAALLALVEFFLTHTGFRWRQVTTKSDAIPTFKKAKKEKKPQVNKEEKEQKKPETKTDAQSRRNRYQRARKK